MKRELFLVLFLSFVLLHSLEPLQIHARETVNVVSLQYSPYQNIDQTGFQNELVREAFKAAGLNTYIHIFPQLRTVHSFYKTDFTVCADGEFINDEKKNKELNIRKKRYWKAQIGLKYYKPNFTPIEINAFDKIKKYSDIDPIFTILSYGGYNPFNDTGFQGVVQIQTISPQQAMRMLEVGRNDFGLEMLGVTPYLVAKDNSLNLKDWGFLSIWQFIPQYMAFNCKNPKGSYYEKKFNEGLSIIKRNGVYTDIYERFYGQKNIPESAIDDPNQEINEKDLAKIVDTADFDMSKYLRQIRDNTGLIIEYVK